MKKLNKFKSFNLEQFLKGKTLLLKTIRKIEKDGFSGARAEVIITEDNTDYGDGVIGANLWSTFTIKIAGINDEQINRFKLNKPVRIIEYTKATVWKPEGAFEESLSIEGKIQQNENQH